MERQDESGRELVDEDSQPLLQAKTSFEVAELGPGSAADAQDSFKQEAKRYATCELCFQQRNLAGLRPSFWACSSRAQYTLVATPPGIV